MLSPHKAANETGAAALDAAPAETALQHDHDRGWRRAGGTPSLAEVFGSIRTRPAGPLWRKLLTFLGPGYLVAVGYMDPGNWATSLAGGSKFGYALLTIALLSNLMAIVLQALCIRLGIASRAIWRAPAATPSRAMSPFRSGRSPSSPSAPPIWPR